MNGQTEPSAPDASAATGEVGSALARSAPVMPFGSYAGLALADVARLDPGHLLALVREGIGPVELRAAAAQALARSPFQPDAAPSGLRRLVPWLLGASLGVAALGVADGRLAGVPPVPAAESPATAAPATATAMATAIAAPAGTAEARAASFPAGASPLPAAPITNSPITVAPITSAPLAAAPLTATPSADADAKAAIAAPPPAGDYDPLAPCGSRAAGAIAAADAAAHLDQFSAIEFAVVGTKDTGKVTFLNSHEPYQGHFYVAIFPDLYAAFPPAPALALTGRCVVIQGRVESFRGVPQIVLHDAADLRDLGPTGPVPATAPTLALP